MVLVPVMVRTTMCRPTSRLLMAMFLLWVVVLSVVGLLMREM